MYIHLVANAVYICVLLGYLYVSTGPKEPMSSYQLNKTIYSLDATFSDFGITCHFFAYTVDVHVYTVTVI